MTSGGDVKGTFATVRVATASLSCLPKVMVAISWRGALEACPTLTEVCMAGPAHMHMLGLEVTHLDCRGSSLMDIAVLRMEVMGSVTRKIDLDGCSMLQEVYFVRSAKIFFLSLLTCKGSCLVPEDLPFYVQTAAGLQFNHPQNPMLPQCPPPTPTHWWRIMCSDYRIGFCSTSQHPPSTSPSTHFLL